MGHGWHTYHTVTMASGGTLTGQVDLGQVYANVFLEVPSMPTNSQIHIQSSRDSSGTFRRVVHPSINSSTVSTNNDFAIASAVTNRMVPMPNGVRFIKIETTMAVGDGCIFRILVSDL